MNNKQVIAIFILGIALLLAAFWAGLNVIKNNTSASVNQSNQKQAVEQASGQESNSDARYVVFVAAYGTREKAEERKEELRRQKYLAAHVEGPDEKSPLYRVNIGPYDKPDADKVAAQLSTEGVKGIMVYPYRGK